jgi:hypothetical protein
MKSDSGHDQMALAFTAKLLAATFVYESGLASGIHHFVAYFQRLSRSSAIKSWEMVALAMGTEPYPKLENLGQTAKKKWNAPLK